jgi:hypothetical protein
VAIFLFAASARVNAFQTSYFDQRYGFPSFFLSRGCIIGSGKRNSASLSQPTRQISAHYNCMRMASPMIEENLNGDAPLTNVDQYPREETEADEVSSSTTTTTRKLKTSSRRRQQLPTNWLGEKNYILFTAVLIGLFTGINIAVFKTAVEFVREVLYGDGINVHLISPYLWNSGVSGGVDEIRTVSLRLSEVLPISVIPAVGGLIVGLLLRFGGDMPPGLRDAVREGMKTFSAEARYWCNHVRVISRISTLLNISTLSTKS